MNTKPREAKYLDVQTAAVVSEGDHGDVTAVRVPAPSPGSMDVESDFVKGTIQEPAFRDKWFGIVFLLHFGTMIALTVLYATGTLKTSYEVDTSNGGDRGRLLDQDEDEMSDFTFIRFMSTFLLSFFIAPMLALLALKLIKSHAIVLIQFSLLFAIGFNTAIGIVLIIYYGALAGIWSLLLAAILACYAKAVWHRIPFVAANLKAAVTCVESNLGMLFLSLASIPLFTGWLFMWLYVFVCAMNSPWMKSQESEFEATDDAFGYSNTHEEETVTFQGGLAISALLLSFYWTWHVLRNVVHTTIAGAVGTWWFLPQEANGCCSRGLRDSLSRSLTYSFGSICLGSLIVAILEVIKDMLQSTANDRRAGILRMVAQCLLICLERIVEYFNKWAFVYVGIYGYSYAEAGKNVFALFRHRGWTTIISDSLLSRMLGMMCFCIALVNALVAALLSLGSSGGFIFASAFLAFFVALLLSSMAFGVLSSAVESIIVLWAEAPAEFKYNHPALCQELEDTWTQAWPDVFSPGVAAVAMTPVV